MNDKDFDEIGKRLRYEEAEPPKNGWKKIEADVHPPAGWRAGMVWTRRHGWKPLMILVPLMVYWGYQRSESTLSGAEGSLYESVVDSPVDSVTTSRLDKEPTRNDPTTIDESATLSQGNLPTDKNTSRSGQPSRLGLNTAADKAHALPQATDGDKVTSQGLASNPDELLDRRSEREEDANLLSGGDEKPAVVTVAERAPDVLSSGREADTGQNAEQRPDDRTSEHSETDSEAEAVVEDTLKPDAASNESEASSESATEDQEDETIRKWRLSVAYSPLFLSTRLKPDKDDDILITNVEKSGPLETVGFRLGMGAGIAVSRSIYLDGQLSFRQSSQKTFYSYSNGKVDTLIAVQQADQSVIVSPVYHAEQAEVKGKTNYAGLSLGATYYFWANTRRRFSFSAGAGLQYLIASSMKEHRDGQWVEIPASSLERINVNVTVGLGYNIMFGHGWELMASPTITSYLGRTTSSQLPYSQSQNSMGINLMLSKTLGKR